MINTNKNIASLTGSVLTFMSVNRANDPMDELFEANVEALAQIETPVDLCNRYCYDRIGYVCILTMTAGYDINCYDMYQR